MILYQKNSTVHGMHLGQHGGRAYAHTRTHPASGTRTHGGVNTGSEQQTSFWSLRFEGFEDDTVGAVACELWAAHTRTPVLLALPHLFDQFPTFPKKDTIDILVERYKDQKIDAVVGIEARGFIFGPPIALAIGAKFVPQRKPRKLPGEVVREEYSLEYGTDCIEMHVGAVQPGERCLIVDDLVATGGTLAAGIRLLERVGAEVVECACLIELADLKGREKLKNKPLFILVDFEGE